MSGHSQFKNIMHRKGAQDAKRAKVFTKLIRELTTAARAGLPDPNMNPRLRSALVAARDANMSRDTIERAIKRGAGGEDGTNYEEVRYEGYGPGGIAIIVEALTDNRNRSASEIRTAFNKHGGAMGETNSVSFMFERKGMVRYPAKAGSADAVFEAALEAGADNVESDSEAAARQAGGEVWPGAGGTPFLAPDQQRTCRRRQRRAPSEVDRGTGRQRRCAACLGQFRRA